MGHLLKFALSVALCLAIQSEATADRFAEARQEMIAEIQEMVTDTRRATAIVRLGPEVNSALGTVPRHEFVPKTLHMLSFFGQFLRR